MKAMKYLIIFLFLILVSTVNFNIQSVFAEDIKIAGVHDLTGPIGKYGQDTIDGAKLGVKHVNEQGLLGGSKLVLEEFDLASDRKQVPPIFRKVISDPKLLVVHGPTGSYELRIAAPIVEESGLAVISTNSVNQFEPGILNEWTFRTSLTETPMLAERLVKELGKFVDFKKVAIVYTSTNDFSKGWSERMANALPKQGYEVLLNEGVSEETIDFSPVLTKILSKKPDIIFIDVIIDHAVGILTKSREMGYKRKFFGGAAMTNSKIYDLAGEAGNGTILYLSFFPKSSREMVQKFVKDYKKEFNREPTQFAQQGYDGTLLIADVIKRVLGKGGGLTRTAIRDEIANTKDLKTVAGEITFAKGPDNIKPGYRLVEVKNKEFIELK
jgi:branched-chain amino acid transport system substrate-binding protein